MALKPTHDRRPAAAGDLIVARIGEDFDWLVLTVAGVDDEGFVSLVRDLDGRNVAVGRVFALSTLESPHLIVPAMMLTAEGRVKAPGLTAPDVDGIKAALAEWKVHA